ncbi:Armadillo repeat-containing protein 3 [Clonorchis sinensis]|uniref:Armadillo repeat-containing protein 3 n=1 Tax=Clonorchis sinensis TaxID=79923 RepID=A0A8T1M8R9_CLOSI|nr:Armadillo repeat-containing protein 3 [Clonorchis sinensis]
MAAKKRIKKDESDSKEGFGPVTVGLREAESAILLLNCSENEVVACACDALYKFLSKNDNNKRLLLKQNLCQNLLPLLSSGDKLVRRNALSILGLISSFKDATDVIRKVPNYLALLRKLLNPEEFDNTREFTLLILKNLCDDSSTVGDVVQEKLIPPIVECLNCLDPDVKKNALDALLKMNKDFEVRSALATTSTLQLLLDQLRSEFPSIQNTALLVFARMTTDSTIRSQLQKMNAFDTFIDLLGKPELNDLHLAALSVIEHLLEDVNCVKDLLRSGKLHTLFRFLCDQEAKHENDKQPQVGASPTKGKGGSPKKTIPQKSPRKAKTQDEKPSVTTLPETKIHACHAVMRAAHNADIRRVLHDADVEQMLVHLLSHEDQTVRSSAAQTIAVVSRSSLCQEKILQLGGLEWLIRMTCSEKIETKSAGALALAALTTGNPAICRELAGRTSGIDCLLSCLDLQDPGTDTAVVAGLTALTSLALEEATRPVVLQRISGKVLVPCLLSGSSTVQTKAALATAAMICEPEKLVEFCENDGIRALVQLLNSPVPDVCRSACWAIFALGADSHVAKLLATSSVIEQLLAINQSTAKRNQFTALALQRLLDAKLEIKFALTGRLDFSDQIQNQFYDVGAVLSVSDVLTLPDYMEQTLNDKRPIYVISIGENHSDEDVSQSGADVELNDADTTETKTLPTSVLTMAVDDSLVQWLEQVSAQIRPLTSPRQQFSELAEFVALQYGGCVKFEDVETFRPELALAELRAQRMSNVIPIGTIRIGNQLHRALLFKFLADQIGLPTTLVRGNYGRSYNEVVLEDRSETGSSHTRTYIVDLMFTPGRLIEATSRKALEYISLF